MCPWSKDSHDHSDFGSMVHLYIYIYIYYVAYKKEIGGAKNINLSMGTGSVYHVVSPMTISCKLLVVILISELKYFLDHGLTHLTRMME